MPSLRSKILSAYGFSKLVMLAFALAVFADLYYLDRQIEQGKAVTSLREAILEMRRNEKNLFLYQDRASHAQLMQQVATAQIALDHGRDVFIGIGGERTFERMDALLRDYRAMLARYDSLDQPQQRLAQSGLRAQGHELSELSQELSHRERQRLTGATRRAGFMLLMAFAGVVLLGMAGGLFLVRRVVRPLRTLEAGLVAIDQGRARELALPSQDQEIRSFVEAFNAMLKHIRQQQDQARRNEKAAALGVLVSGVAHELNNPLSNISTSVQLIMEEGDAADPELRQTWLEQIDGETERARRIVRRLLDSVRQPRLQLQTLPLDELVASALKLLHRQLPDGVHICIGAIADSEVRVDRERLQQVFINLLKNAADAGARHIRISAQPAQWHDDLAEAGEMAGDPAVLRQTGRALRIAVEDDGPGIPPHVLAHIFEPFYTTRAAGEGTGLGLYLVEEIVAEHQGCILVDCPPSGGTRFSIWLPHDHASRDAPPLGGVSETRPQRGGASTVQTRGEEPRAP
jgi:signal transduction histidine kinase